MQQLPTWQLLALGLLLLLLLQLELEVQQLLLKLPPMLELLYSTNLVSIPLDNSAPAAGVVRQLLPSNLRRDVYQLRSRPHTLNGRRQWPSLGHAPNHLDRNPRRDGHQPIS